MTEPVRPHRNPARPTDPSRSTAPGVPDPTGGGAAAGQGELALEGVPRRLFRATPTRLTGWLDCPRRYRFTYLERPTPPKGPPWAHNSLGASVHTALASWWALPLPRRTPESAATLVRTGWLTDGYRDDAQSARFRSYASALVRRYTEALDPTREPLGIERTVATTTSVLALSGRIDRLDARDDELVVVDYKTGRHASTTDDARTSLALAVYAVAAARTMRRRCVRVELHHLPSGSVARWEHTPESLQRHLGRADAIGLEASAAEEAYKRGPNGRLEGDAADEVFPPRPGPQCQWCDFSTVCPEGRKAFPARRSWEGLDAAVDAGEARAIAGTTAPVHGSDDED